MTLNSLTHYGCSPFCTSRGSGGCENCYRERVERARMDAIDGLSCSRPVTRPVLDWSRAHGEFRKISPPKFPCYGDDYYYARCGRCSRCRERNGTVRKPSGTIDLKIIRDLNSRAKS